VSPPRPPSVRPGAASYPADVELYDFRYDGVRPAGIAYCASADDVARCVAFARAHHLTPTPRAGGHSYAGYSLSNGLVVDVTRMAAVAPPVGGPGGGARGPGPATIGAGARLIDVYSGLNAAGVSVAAGSCPTVGITGLALGGGIGVVSRLHGLTADAIRAVRIVTTDSRTVTATPSEHEDLYWASRGGGGGNFGIVTAFEMATFATAPVTIFFLRWPGAAAADVLPAWQHWVPTTPDELWSTCLLAAEPAAGLGVSVGGVVVGSTATTAALVARLTAVTGTPALSLLTPEAFPQAMFVEAGCAGLALAACHLTSQGGSLPRAPSVAKSDMLTAPLADAAVRIVVDAVTARQDAGRPGAVAYDSLGGAAGRVAPTATAWSHREALFSVQYSVPLAAGGPASDVADDVAWLSAMYSRLRPYVSGQAYQNYIDPALGDWARAYYGPNLARLRQVKRSWDPDRVLDFAQAIPPA
jgi:FAD/FMN-containing dehydrogenase